MHTFLERPGLWEQTGCFHRMAAYCPQASSFCNFVEDIGRHNCVDRLAGWALKSSQSLSTTTLLCSSRVTGSLMAKITRAGFPMIISRSATTQAAITQAQAAGITLVGFTRENGVRFSVIPTTGSSRNYEYSGLPILYSQKNILDCHFRHRLLSQSIPTYET